VPTADGDAWFKENPPGLAFEPALTLLVERRRPDCTPPVLAAEGPRLLTRDTGRQLRELHAAGEPAPDWEEILPLYAEAQIDLAADVAAALEAGTPDKRPEALPALFEQLPGAAVHAGAVRHAADALRDTVPATVVHEELGENNVFVRDGRPYFVDWAEACVSHPFAGPLLPLRAATERAGLEPGTPPVERLRDLYLEPFTRFAPLTELRKAFAHGYLLAAACRALTWDSILAPLPASVSAELDEPVARWLDVLHGLAAGTTRLGDA
jgi:Phosphotransferase enzyme family